ncbi:MAG: glutamine--tRNA ligase/YqeY domain fusion protein [Candidatus Eisenbacteria bacterium]
MPEATRPPEKKEGLEPAETEDERTSPSGRPSLDFIRAIVADDLATGKHTHIQTRFPPEPNGYLHIGHAKAFALNFGIAAEFGGKCNLRFDDTNPEKEDVEYVDSIQEDIRWLGFDWGDRLFFASDYFERLYAWAQKLIRDGKAYVCDLSADQMREYRGTLTEPGRNSPYRNRSVEENLDLFARMRAGEFNDGARVLRAKIDMAAPNVNLRDPVMYRIRRAHHHRTGDAWCIYPSYDWAHGQSDAIEGITHSLCSLEFEDHRPLYDWFLDQLGLPEQPRQIEFARLNLTYTVMSKRKLRELVAGGFVRGWDDPRMPTLAAMRRRGFPPEAIRAFLERVGVAKRDSVVEYSLLEHAVREELNRRAPRVMGVLRPLEVVIDNYPEDQVEEMPIGVNPEDPGAGTRMVPFSRTIWIEQDDFRETPPPKYHRLFPGSEVRLRGAYLVRCTSVEKDGSGAVVRVHCTYDPQSKGGSSPDGRKVKGTIHWVSARHAVRAEVRLYEHLFLSPFPEEGGRDFKEAINPESLEVIGEAWVEPSVAGARPGDRFQFERIGYFCVDPDSRPGDGGAPGQIVFNRVVTLRDSWAKIEQKAGA